jgi:CheY-like chemotaxis protein
VVRSALLLAETEPELRAYLGRNLSGDGFDVIEAARSGEALDLAEQQRPALIVADDPDLCRRLREGLARPPVGPRRTRELAPIVAQPSGAANICSLVRAARASDRGT